MARSRWRHITVGLSAELHARLSRLADDNERLTEQEAAFLLRRAVDQVERDPAWALAPALTEREAADVVAAR